MRRFLFGLAGFAGCGPQAQRRFAPPTRAPPVRPPAAGGLRPSGSCTLFHLRGTPGRRDAAFFGSLQGAGCGPQARRRFAPPTRAPPVRPPQAGGLRPSGSCTLFHLRGTPGRRDAAFFGSLQGAGCGPQARRRFAPPTRAPPVRPPQAGGLRPSGSCTLFHLRGTPGRRDAAFFGSLQGAGCGPQARRRFAPPTRAKPVRPPAAGGLRPSPSACSSFRGRCPPPKAFLLRKSPRFPRKRHRTAAEYGRAAAVR